MLILTFLCINNFFAFKNDDFEPIFGFSVFCQSKNDQSATLTPYSQVLIAEQSVDNIFFLNRVEYKKKPFHETKKRSRKKNAFLILKS